MPIVPKDVATRGYLQGNTLGIATRGYLKVNVDVVIDDQIGGGVGGYTIRYIEKEEFTDDSDLLLILNVFAKICF